MTVYSLESVLAGVLNSSTVLLRHWQLGLYLYGQDPCQIGNLTMAEVEGNSYSRVAAETWQVSTTIPPSGNTSVTYRPVFGVSVDSEAVWAGLPAVTLGGVFLARTADTEALHKWPFTGTGVAVQMGAMVKIAPGNLIFELRTA